MPVILKKYYPTRNLLFFFGEGLLIFFTVTVTQFLFYGDYSLVNDELICLQRAGLVTIVFQLSLYFFDLYDLGVVSSFTDTAARITQAFGAGVMMLAAIYYIFPQATITSTIFWVGYLAICVVIMAWRTSYLLALRQKMFTQPVVLLGNGSLAESIHKEISERMDSGFRIVAYVSSKPLAFPVPDHVHVVNEYCSLQQICLESNAERIVVALEDRRGATPVKELIDCRLQGTIISQGIGFYEKLTGKIMVEKAKPDWIIYSGGFKTGRTSSFCKRATDILLSAFGLLISLPITLVSALIIKLESPGPIFYTQERVGENGKAFKIIKFRSMGQDAEKNGAVWAMVNDNRVTKFGGFIRKVRIDEIPQMWNILIGEMSFVGPRPERSVFVEQLDKKIPYYSLRHSIKPGLTGWAQICYPYGASEEDALRKLEYDLYYLKNISISLDLWIIFKTAKTVLFKKGAR